MYDLILTELYRLNRLQSAAEKAQYLQSLQPVVHFLRDSYRRPFVNVDYRAKKTQAAYMLTYVPQYSQIICIILNELKHALASPFNQEDLTASFFGSGPLPELYGLLQFLRANFSVIRKVTAYAFDIYADEWTYSRNITKNHLIPSIWRDHQLELKSKTFDLSQAESVEEYRDIIASSKLIVFQNCLNEVRPSQHSTVLNNFTSLVNSMSSNSILLITDLSNYRSALKLMQEIEGMVVRENSLSTLISSISDGRSYDARNIVNTMPLVMRKNLLTGNRQNPNGLIPRISINYRFLAIEKT